MSWDSIFADAHFEPSHYTLPIGSASNTLQTIQLSPLQYITDVDPVGLTYHRLVFPAKKEYVVPTNVDDGVDIEELLDSVREADLEDYYALLGLEEKGLSATDEDIKKHWKHINLHLHPDKADAAKKEAAEIRFKQCSKAFETLTHPVLRIEYDSHWRVDDSIPSATAGATSVEDFLKVYKPVFERNARFSKIKPVPSLGDEKTTEKQLNTFYNFWQTFQSWREFPQGDTEKVGSSASRDERRRAEQKNKKGRETLKAQDMARIRLLVSRAQAVDPRLKKKAAATATTTTTTKATATATPKGIPTALQAKAQANAANKAAAASKSSTTTTTNNAQKIAEEEAQKLKQEKERKLKLQVIAESRTRLFGALSNEITMFGKKSLIEDVVSKLTQTYEDCQKINDILLQRGYNDVQGVNGKGVLEVPCVINLINSAEGKALIEEKTETKDKEWTSQELKLLATATAKIPVGTKERWQKVADFVNQANAGAGAYKRTEKDVLKKIRQQEVERQLGGKAKLEALKSAPVTVATPAPTPPAPVSTQLEGGFDKEVLTWSAEEQKKLETGLQTIAKDAQDRWQLIASIVGSRSAGQCAERFNYLRYQVQKKKEAAAAAKK